MVPTDTAPLALRRETGDLAEGAAKLAGEIGSSGIGEVLARANRVMVRKGAQGALGTMRPKPAEWYAFDAKDEDTTDWYPQGLTGSEESGSIEEPAFLVTWYFKPSAGERGIRVSFVSPRTLKYRNALLVAARPDGSYGPIGIHAGGVACDGDLLYVADTTRGLRVFDLGKVLDLRTAQDDLGDPERVGRHGGRFHAFGYRYVIPQTDFWRVAQPGPRFSFVSIDRSGGTSRLVTGEYREDDPGGWVARWPLPLGGGEPEDAFVMGHPKIQGAISWGGRWYLSQAAGSSANGKLLVHADGGLETRAFPVGPEDLTVQDGKLWSVTEFKDRRIIFGVPL
ncbi:hypothetical protein FH608_021825 [Nonomuraea phyllanthi]|uniref:Uncharacterized protein n=1 Tax=Nonomuraea phyllanthi TaxID=2219224 RepID=A0A5C4WDQ9_9ACTN|nr:hypothetical protein [Nonomuraea phyllanthi]KAB8192986.1 hypothetical protein FH608_021825 [Nonomuraea phyllanthi]